MELKSIHKEPINQIGNFDKLVKEHLINLFGNDELCSYQINSSKLFVIDNKLAMLLYNTDCDIKYKHLPFANIILNTNLDLGNNWILKGLWISDCGNKEDINYIKSNLIKEKSYSVESLIIFGVCANTLTGEGDIFSTSIDTKSYKKDEEGLSNSLIVHKEDKTLNPEKIKSFVSSFLNFLYNPDIEIVERNLTEVQIKRNIRKDRVAEDNYYIKISGKTRIYLDNINEEHFNNEYLKSNHASIVRGFYRHLRSLRYKYQREIWIPPFIRGLGELKEKTYIISDKTIWIKQITMEGIIRSLFSNHIVLTNTRGFLNGLEIDCYIPDLRLGFEYNGEQHYNYPNAFHKTEEEFNKQIERDKVKNELAIKNNIKLITIKFDEDITNELIKQKVGDYLGR